MGEFLRVADLEEIPEGGVLRVTVNDEPVAVFRVGGKVYAIGDTCSHAQASLSEGELDDYVIECPLHGARFDIRTGKNLRLPAVRPVPSYRVRVVEGGVWVAVD